MTEDQNDDFLLAKRIAITEEKIACLATDSRLIRKRLAAARAELVAATQDRRAVAREAPDDPDQVVGWLAQLKFVRETERDARFEVSRLHKALFALLRETRELEFEESKAIDGRFQFLPLFDPPKDQPAGTVDELIKILGRVATPRYTVPPFSWRVWDSAEGFFMQPRFVAFCDTTKAFGQQAGRKWFVSRHATPDEVVRTAFLAVMTCIEHEIREGFLYEGKAIFGPHISVEALADVADKRSQRPDPPAEVT